jgi:hypothetical protein
MKKVISLISALGLCVITVLADSSGGVKHTALQFLAGGGNMFLTNGGTYTNFGTNTIYLNSQGTSNIVSAAPYFTNTIVQPSGTTVSNILTYAPAQKDVQGWADVNGDVAPLTLSMMLNNTGYLPADNQVLSPGTNFPGLYAFLNASNTQTITIYLQKIVWGTNADNSSSNQFVFAMTANGTNTAVYSTNLPTAFVQGAVGFRLAGAWSTTNANTLGTTINRVTISGFAP